VHRECPEKTNTESTLSCCNCTLVEGEKPHPASYRGCSHEKGEQQRRRAQRAPKGFSGRTFFSKFTSSEQSYAAASRQDTQQQQPQARRQTGKRAAHRSAASPLQDIQKTGLSVRAPSSSDYDKLKVSTVVRQIMKELSEAVSEEDKVMIVIMMVLDLMKRNGC
jgi:hypothetical protein